jgi:hypothetical protein
MPVYAYVPIRDIDLIDHITGCHLCMTLCDHFRDAYMYPELMNYLPRHCVLCLSAQKYLTCIPRTTAWFSLNNILMK